MLSHSLYPKKADAGCDEAGRGCLAGPVFAAAVILPAKFRHELLNDSKQLSRQQRETLRSVIEKEAIAWAVASCDPEEIDKINILQASIRSMHKALDQLSVTPVHLSIDGNYFRPYRDLPHTTVIQGDGTYMNIAAASILAKTYRDDFMRNLHETFPHYGWESNKGYATKEHVEAIKTYGRCEHHRKSFILKDELQASLF